MSLMQYRICSDVTFGLLKILLLFLSKFWCPRRTSVATRQKSKFEIFSNHSLPPCSCLIVTPFYQFYFLVLNCVNSDKSAINLQIVQRQTNIASRRDPGNESQLTSEFFSCSEPSLGSAKSLVPCEYFFPATTP